MVGGFILRDRVWAGDSGATGAVVTPIPVTSPPTSVPSPVDTELRKGFLLGCKDQVAGWGTDQQQEAYCGCVYDGLMDGGWRSNFFTYVAAVIQDSSAPLPDDLGAAIEKIGVGCFGELVK